MIRAARLARYLSGSHAPSNFRTMAVLAATVAHSSTPCRACKGLGFRELDAAELARWTRLIAKAHPDERAVLRARLSAESTCPVCNGGGHTYRRARLHRAPGDSMFSTTRCWACRGTGEVVEPSNASAERGDVCLRCGGSGYVVPLTTRETGSSKRGRAPALTAGDDEAATEPNEDDLLERVVVSRELEHVRQTDPDVAVALAAYYGPGGERWAAHRWGRAFALWPLTAAGRQLAEWAAAHSNGRHGYLVPELELIARERDAELRGDRNPARRALLSQADASRRPTRRRGSCSDGWSSCSSRWTWRRDRGLGRLGGWVHMDPVDGARRARIVIR